MRRYPLIRRTAAHRAAIRFAVGTAVLVTACSALVDSPTTPATVGVSIATGPGERLTFEPAETTIALAHAARVEFRNTSSLAHNLVFTGTLNVSTRTIVAPGTTDELQLDLQGPGRYPFVCTIHAEMAGALIVEGATSDGTSQGAASTKRGIGSVH